MILHLVPDHVFLNRYQGSYKDVIGRTNVLKTKDGFYRQVVLHSEESSEVDRLPEDIHPSHILVEYSSLGRIVAALRSRWPNAFIGVRAHNIEPLQQIDSDGWTPVRKIPRLFYGCLRLLHKDWLSARYADAIYSISEWEAEKYWKRMPSCKRALWLPYFTPDYLVSGGSSLPREIIACLPNAVEHRKTRDLVERFGRFASTAKALGDSHTFAITGDLSRWSMKMPSSAEQTGMIEDLADFMTRVKAVAMLSPLGYGFKTTIADAIAAGCYVIVHPSIYRRCPNVLRPACIILPSLTDNDVAAALGQLKAPFPLTDTTETLKGIVTRMLANDFGQDVSASAAESTHDQ